MDGNIQSCGCIRPLLRAPGSRVCTAREPRQPTARNADDSRPLPTDTDGRLLLCSFMDDNSPTTQEPSTSGHVPAGVRSRAWFDQGCDAFKRSFPLIARQVPAERFYVCPICLHAFSEEALALRVLSREDVPPKSMGGRKLVLTCRRCNSEGGHEADSHARREADLYDFATGDLREIKAGLTTASGSVPIRLSASGGGILMFGVPAATAPTTHAHVMGDFEDATRDGKWEGFSLKLAFPAFSPERARASWLRSAYLAFFAALGYRFIFRPELDMVRARIRDPRLDEPRTFRILRPESSAPALIRVEQPDVFRSYAMFYRRNVVFLPRYNDHGLYGRLAEHPETTVTAAGIEYPWPTRRPTFYHDRSPQ